MVETKIKLGCPGASEVDLFKEGTLRGLNSDTTSVHAKIFVDYCDHRNENGTCTKGRNWKKCPFPAHQ